MDREDAKDLMKACIEEAEIDVKATRFPKADVLCDVFSMAVNKCQEISETLANQYSHFQHLTPSIEALSVAYAERKKATNSMDFDDLLVQWLNLMMQDADTREYYQRKFQFILVDEYQDTNQLQGDLIDLLAERNKNLMVVGDDAQSIYSWRGANFRNILGFPERYEDARVYKIETNYRSTPDILDVANAVIAGNTDQFEKELGTFRDRACSRLLFPAETPVSRPCSLRNARWNCATRVSRWKTWSCSTGPTSTQWNCRWNLPKGTFRSRSPAGFVSSSRRTSKTWRRG